MQHTYNGINNLKLVIRTFIKLTAYCKVKQKKEVKKQPAPKTVVPSNILWFDKEVTIPRDLPLAELNLEISSYLRSINFFV